MLKGEKGVWRTTTKKALAMLYKPLTVTSQYIDSHYLCVWRCSSYSLCPVLTSKFHSRC